ncbi:hypothetical protein N7474_005335 [Penicillium riverlandense]|uniref:uncharacterized protein n=1 Tax=Penicillium riverlandense TaxID=1903569 RepID=UPI00254968C1|nr:uncharacterized protein N7474_005335 [Penicillium riverlandense]KAJ5819744.1 hypothetical protein N7474_005335 [Penicillium riverlandense]
MAPYIKTAQTAWPANTPESIKDFVEVFFQLLDGGTSEAAKQWSELWVPDGGEFHAFGQIFKGRDEIEGYLFRSQKIFAGLNHIPKKVYIHGQDGMDLTVITTYEITFPNGKYVSGESAAMLEFAKQDSQMFVRMNRLIIVSVKDDQSHYFLY